MNPLISCILFIFIIEVRSKKALIFNLRTRKLDDVFHYDSYKKYFPYMAACPASTPLEKQFDKDVSLTKRSLFVRLISDKNESLTDNDVDFCEKSFEPAILYNSQEKQYEIGYEVYFSEGGMHLPEANDYDHLRTVNTKNSKYEIENQRIFDFANKEYQTWSFCWINLLSIECSKNNKRVKFQDLSWRKRLTVEFEHLNDDCKNYLVADDRLYSKENQKKHLKNILVPSSLFEGNPDLSCGQPYGCLTPSQILPLWYFDSSSARFASCSHINLIPVWKSIADGNLRKVDIFVATIVKKLVNVNEIIFGVNGVLKMMVPGGFQKMYLSDAKRDWVVEIPKIIYRIIKFEAYNKMFISVIVIHNDPTTVRDADRLCDEDDALPGWDKITNDDPKTGLTYVCRMTPEIEKKLEVNYYDISELQLGAVPRKGYSGEIYYDYEVHRLHSSLERLLKQYPK